MTRRRTITPATVRRLALAFPEATAGAHFHRPDFRVRNKIFAALPDGGRIVGLKSTPSNVDALVSADAVTFTDLWRGRWVGVRLDRVSLPVLRELIGDAWCLAAPKRLAASWTQSAQSAQSAKSAKPVGHRLNKA